MNVRPDFALHRQRLLERLGADEAVLLFGAAHPLRNGDSEFKYRPDSDVYWLTVRDGAISEVAALLPEGAVALHASGALGPDVVPGGDSAP